MTLYTKASTALALCLFAAPASADSRLLINCFFPPQHQVCAEILPAWKEKVEEVTERRVRVSFPAQSMAPPPEQLASVRAGLFDGAVQFQAFIAGEAPGPQVAMMPFAGVGNAHTNSVALWRTWDAVLSKGEGQYEGVKLLGLFTTPGGDFYSMTDTPITSLESAANRKMWASPGGPSEILKAAGGSVVSGPAVQMTEIIQRGVVDGYVGIAVSDSATYNTLPYVKSITQTERKIISGAFSFFVSDAAWAEISPEDQEAIMAVSGEAFADLAGSIWQEKEDTAQATLMGDLDVIQADAAFEAELDAAGKAYTDKWVETVSGIGIDGRQALETYRAEIDQILQQN